MSYFRKSHLMKLKNQEFAVAYNEVIDLLDSEDITVEYVTKALAGAKAESAKLVFLRNMRRKHHLTHPINQLMVDRNDYFTALTMSVKTGLKLPSPASREAAAVLTQWLEAYKEPLSKVRLVQQTSLATQLLEELSREPRIMSAVEELALEGVLESIANANSDVKVQIQKRAKDLVASRRKAQELKRNAYEKLMVLLDALKMAIKLGDGERAVYVRYVNEINQVLDFYRATVTSRNTRNKNAAEQKKAEQEGELEGKPEDGLDDGDQGDGVSTDTKSKSSSSSSSTKDNNTLGVLVLDADDSQTKEGSSATAIDVPQHTDHNMAEVAVEAPLADGDATVDASASQNEEGLN